MLLVMGRWNADVVPRAADIGKLYNGNSLLNYSPAPKGWSHIDVLVSAVTRVSLPNTYMSDIG